MRHFITDVRGPSGHAARITERSAIWGLATGSPGGNSSTAPYRLGLNDDGLVTGPRWDWVWHRSLALVHTSVAGFGRQKKTLPTHTETSQRRVRKRRSTEKLSALCRNTKSEKARRNYTRIPTPMSNAMNQRWRPTGAKTHAYRKDQPPFHPTPGRCRPETRNSV